MSAGLEDLQSTAAGLCNHPLTSPRICCRISRKGLSIHRHSLSSVLKDVSPKLLVPGGSGVSLSLCQRLLKVYFFVDSKFPSKSTDPLGQSRNWQTSSRLRRFEVIS